MQMKEGFFERIVTWKGLAEFQRRNFLLIHSECY